MRYALITALVLVFLILGRPDYLSSPDADLWLRALTYHVFHANIFHLAANILSIWFVFMVTPVRSDKTNISQLVAAYVIATLTFFIATRPVVGVSNILFAVLGLRTPAFNHPWWRSQNTLVFFAITLGMLALPQFAAVTHIVSFICGTILAVVRRCFNSLEDDYRRATGK